jgi:Icc-related predicted phosphoesterase
MKVTSMSDLHLEFHGLGDLPGGDVLILAGDIWCVRHMWNTDKQHDWYRRFCDVELGKYKHVLVTTGNHESYGFCIDDQDEAVRAFLSEYAPHARLLNNEVEVIDGVAFLGSPLWAPCGARDPSAEVMIRNSMNDFVHIKKDKGAREFRPADAAQLHDQAVAWLRDELPKHGCCVVFTHHAPSLLSARGSERFIDARLDDAYCSNQHGLIEANSQIAVWIHGHTHRAERYRVGQTTILANPRGYFPSESIAREFDPSAIDFTIDEAKGIAI